jgi:glycosyltransferase involved in cell wall biosynthesis
VGFCMYLRAEALYETGVFDEEKFGRGYGEENDWCLRALDRGFRHLCACDVFVEHLGGVSFGKREKAQLVQRNLAVLTSEYPEYTQVVRAFIRKDPLAAARNSIGRVRLTARLKGFTRRVVFVTHGLGGGIDAHCRDLTERLEGEGVAVLTLAPSGAHGLELRFGDIRLGYRRTEMLGTVAADLRALGVSFVHLHSDIGYEGDVWELPWKLGVPFDVTVHDYLAICPRVNLTNPEGRYCREPSDPAECQRCIAVHRPYLGLEARYGKLGGSVVSWRAVYGDRLFGARKVFVPNEDVAERFGRYFPDLPVEVRPHPLDAFSVRLGPPPALGPVRKVAVVGAIGPHKGYETLLACARDAMERKLPLQYVVVGFSMDDEELADLPNVVITGPYDDEMLPGLLAGERFVAALFLSEWPETYSYTLVEALRAGITPVVLDVGAPANRLRRLGVGRRLPIGSLPGAINDALLEVAADEGRLLELTEGSYRSLVSEYYGLEEPALPK